MIPPRFRSKDHAAAALLVAMGAAAAIAGRSYRIGSLQHMGAGFVPVVLGGLMIAVGLLIGLGAQAGQPAPTRAPRSHGSVGVDLRAAACILGGLAAFVLFGTYGGLVPATFACVFLSALGDRQNGWRDAAMLAAALVVAGYLIFGVGLKLQFDAFQWG